MHARITSGSIRPEKIEETVNTFRDKLIPRAKTQEGFKDIFFLIDSKTNKFHIISLWDSEENMLAGESTMFLFKQLSSIVPHFAAKPITERFQVAIKA
jgi:heme-degrading monooxygenase HmoA